LAAHQLIVWLQLDSIIIARFLIFSPPHLGSQSATTEPLQLQNFLADISIQA
jgi:hypothetical protein